MHLKLSVILFISVMLYGCGDNQSASTENNKNQSDTGSSAAVSPSAAQSALDTTPIQNKKEVPILCYHQIRNWTGTDSKQAKDYIIEENNFRAQMKMLADSGYHTVLPDEVLSYLEKGTPLPEKPVMLTFDDTDDDQFTIAKPELDKYKFKGVFFIMTVSIGRPRYMTKEQIKQLSDEGHTIGAHTWDHHMVTKYTDVDYPVQLQKPRELLEKITGKPVKHFAYPFGLWNDKIIQPLKDAGYISSYQLASKRSQSDPKYTIRRIIASGYWSPQTMMKAMNASFRMRDDRIEQTAVAR
jgi:peptidoglycan/xylan/chitin deacetylase (PgdA/CDA1 family)